MPDAAFRRNDAAFDVSVVMPSYNSEAYIASAIDSVLGQQGVAVQVIVVDDQGTDRTREILEEMRQRAANLTVIQRPPKGGQATARNDGMAVAEGRYIAFLDSDDALDGPDVLANWVSHADADNLDISCGQFTVVSRDGAVQPGRRVSAAAGPACDVAGAPHLVNVTSCWQMLYRTDFLRSKGLVFSPKLRQREDRLFFIDALLSADRIGVTPLSVVRHLIHPDSSFHQIDLDQLRQYNIHLREMLAVMERADAAGRMSADFASANAQVYWRMLFTYWAPFVLQCLGEWPGGATAGPRPATPEADAAFELFECMRAFPLANGAFYDSTLLATPPNRTGLVVEGGLDVGRLAVAAERYDFVVRLLQGKRLLFNEARLLAADGKAAWAEEVVCRYMSFHRNKIFAAPPDDGAEPPVLGRLVRRLVLHVGPPKTGSSALQLTLERNRLRLIGAGVHYPLTGTRHGEGVRRERTDGHARIVERILRRAEGIERELALEVASLGTPIDTLVLSSENIVSHRFWDHRSPDSGRNMIERIVQTLGIEQVEILILLRRQDEWFESYYREVMANPFNGLTDTAEEFFVRLKSRGLFDFEAVESALTIPERIRMVHLDAYERVRGDGGTVNWALKVIGAGNIDLVPMPRKWTNESLTDAVAANVRLAKVNSNATRAQLSDVYVAAVNDAALANSGYRLIAPKRAAAIAEALGAELSWFDARFPDVAATRKVVRPQQDFEPLPLLPQTAAMIDKLRTATPPKSASTPPPQSKPKAKTKPKTLSKAARLRQEKRERSAHAGAALAEATVGQFARVAVVVPIIRILKGSRRARLYATRVLTLPGDQ